MSDNPIKKKKYEPPIVKEIGGVFEQALGLTCLAGNHFTGSACSNGISPVTSGCAAGPRDIDMCQAGVGNANKCASGTGVTK